MRRYLTLQRLFSALLLFSFLSACAAPPADAPAALSSQPSAVAVSSTPPVSTTAPSGAPTRPALTPGQPAASPTPDLRLPPEQWRDWPVVPEVTPRALEIYRLGQTLGNDPAHFSKVGDCQSIKEALLGMFDRPGYYQLDPSEKDLEQAIAHFAGSFNRDGQAVQGGFNAASVLSPMWANPDACQAGENPLECEYRIHKPAFALISLEVWWNGRTPERYEQYMRRIIDYAAAHGVVPILSTKADNVEGDNSINLTTARLAYEYDLPLWNWWRAAQDLPNSGLDPTRPDGFHLAEEAWLPRSITALQALDSIWRGVTAASPAAGTPLAAAPTAAPQIAPTDAPPTPEPEETVQPFQAGKASGRVLLSLAARKDETLHPLGIFRLDVSTGVKEQIVGEGAVLQGLSPRGRLLFSRGRELFTVGADGADPVKVSSALAPGEGTIALWLPDGGIAYLAALEGQTALVYDRLDGSGWTRLTGASDRPVELFPAPATGQVFWGGPDGVFSTTLQGTTSPLEGITRPFFSPLHPNLIFIYSKREDFSELVLAQAGDKTGDKTRREAPLPGNHVLDASWSPDGKRLSVLLLNRSDYSGRWGSINHFLFTPADFGTRELPRASGLSPRSVWSPGGQSLLLVGTQPRAAGYQVYARVIDTNTLAAVELTGPLNEQSPDLLLVTAAAWEE